MSLDASLLTHFRRHFPTDVISQVNPWIVDAARSQSNDEDSYDGEEEEGCSTDEPSAELSADPENHGTLFLDASCVPQDIRYPTNVRLLHESCQKLEVMMDTLQAGRETRKPRNYRRRAQK